MKKLRIVVVDDDPDVRRIAETLLRNAGFQVFTAGDGHTGLDLIRSEKPALVVLDLMMPGMHGFAVCQEMQADPSLRGIHILVTSSKAYPVDIKKAKELGAADYLVKPFDLAELLEKVKALLGSRADTLWVKFWGTRGSIPTPGQATARYGGNTSCVEVRAGDKIVLFDCGSGAREMGLALGRECEGRVAEVHLFVSHTHWDHIQGFPFFTPAYVPGNRIVIFSLRGADKSLEKIFTGQMDASYFPVSLADMQAELVFVELEGTVQVGNMQISHIYLNHPGLAVGYRIDCGGKSLAYIADHEPYPRLLGDNEHNRKQEREITNFAHNVDLYIRDAQYTEEEYVQKRGWGHSPWPDVLEAAHEAGVKQCVLYHHDPLHDDATMDRILAECHLRMKQAGMNFSCIAATDKLVITL